jgi:hypothetical protein
VAACERFERSASVWGKKSMSRHSAVGMGSPAASGLATAYRSASSPKVSFGFMGALFFLQPWSMTG